MALIGADRRLLVTSESRLSARAGPAPLALARAVCKPVSDSKRAPESTQQAGSLQSVSCIRRPPLLQSSRPWRVIGESTDTRYPWSCNSRFLPETLFLPVACRLRPRALHPGTDDRDIRGCHWQRSGLPVGAPRRAGIRVPPAGPAAGGPRAGSLPAEITTCQAGRWARALGAALAESGYWARVKGPRCHARCERRRRAGAHGGAAAARVSELICF